MKNKFCNLFLSATLFAFALTFVACEGDQGEPGPAGAAGAQGDKGDKGDAGAGLDQTTDYGNITATVEGTIPSEAGGDFTFTQDFKFAPDNADGIWFSEVWAGEGDERYFYVERYAGILEHDGNYIEIRFTENNGTISNVQVYGDFPVKTSNFKFFELEFGDYDGYGYANEELSFTITNFSYDENTGVLSFDYSGSVNDNYNSTYDDITISGEADVIVYENIQQPI